MSSGMSPRLLDPNPVDSLQQYRAAGGFVALEDARNVAPEAVVATIADAGLRGRGGAGFPTGVKWRTVAENAARSEIAPTVVVNAAEGEPGSFSDRTLLRRNPFRVLEGALIAAHAVEARSIIVVTKERFEDAHRRLAAAAEEITVSGTADGVDIEVVGGPNHYLLGEETGLLEVAAGRPPFPRVAPPFRHGATEVGDPSGGAADLRLAGEHGMAPPTLVNNVETLANVPGIIAHGPDWFREVGTDESPGSMVFTVSGDVRRGGVGEFPLGTPLRTIIDELSGGVTEGEIAFVLSGIAGGAIAAEALDTPASYEGMEAVGAGLGTGGLLVFSTETDPIAVAHGISRFLAVESCGQCTPCKHTGLDVADELDRLRSGVATDDAIERLVPLLRQVPVGARCDLGRQHERVVASLLSTFSDVAVAHATEGLSAEPVLIAPIVDIDEDGTVTLDEDHATKQPDWSHDDEWNGQTPADVHDVAVTIG